MAITVAVHSARHRVFLAFISTVALAACRTSHEAPNQRFIL
jgi:hypothetical protein